jgi:hypothetical protein
MLHEFKRAGFLLDTSSWRTQPYLDYCYMGGEPLEYTRKRAYPCLSTFSGGRTAVIWSSQCAAPYSIANGDETYETLIHILLVMVA